MKRRFQLLPLILFALLFVVLNFYVLSGLQLVLTSKMVPYVFWGLILTSVGALIFALRGFRTKNLGLFFKTVTHFFLILFVGELLFAIVLLLGDIYRFFSGMFLLIAHHHYLAPPRNLYWIEFALVLFIAVVLLFFYGIIRGKYAYRVIKHILYFKDLPAAFDGFKLTQISDVHAGSFTNPQAVQRGIDLIIAQRADLFVFTGDLVNNKAEEIKPWISRFSQIKAPFGQFSVLGNHDYGDYVQWKSDQAKRENLAQLKQYHQDLGFRLLLDEHVELYKNNEKIILAGIENWGLGFGERGDLAKALQNTNVNDFKILLSHDPSHWEAQVKNHPSKIHLTLAGHTHGMQFGIEAFGLKWSPVKLRYKHWAGLKEENERILNINRGFGFIGFSGRVGIWPEVTVIELKKA
jgi:predicted MPP superfamily phosphohydrolase